MKRFKYVVIFAILIGILGISGKINSKVAKEQVAEVSVSLSSDLLNQYRQLYTQDIVKSAMEDLNMDGKEDGVIIYRENKNQNFMVVVVTDKDNYYITKPVKAPLSNQKIEFKDIDKKDEMEVIISGEKNGALGYGIFRIVSKQFKDIFAEGMEFCC